MPFARVLSPSPAARNGGRLGVLLTLLALFGLAVLSAWHENHPDLPYAAPVTHATAAAASGHSGQPDLDHLMEHAALHAIGLPALPATVEAMPLAIALFHPLALVRRTSTAPPRPLRPPQG